MSGNLMKINNKGIGQEAFTDEERAVIRARRAAMLSEFDGKVFELREDDSENGHQFFFVVTARPQKNGEIEIHFSRTVFTPDGKNHDKFLNPRDPADQVLIRKHYETAYKRFVGANKDMTPKMDKNEKKKQKWARFVLPRPVYNHDEEKPANFSRVREELRENHKKIMSTPFNLFHIGWNQDNADVKAWYPQLIAAMRSYMVTHPMPTHKGIQKMANA
tara:strand:+ start:7019 stop:7672 length:654 start_codon:yes stop_codon:yes gene_type:complete